MKALVAVFRDLKQKYWEESDSDDDDEPSLILLHKIRASQDILQISENVQERASYIGIV
mgnify:CR=1 FL=1